MAAALTAFAERFLVQVVNFPYRTAADHTKGVTAFFKGDDLRRVDRCPRSAIAPPLHRLVRR